jgi:hypothetical protein
MISGKIFRNNLIQNTVERKEVKGFIEPFDAGQSEGLRRLFDELRADDKVLAYSISKTGSLYFLANQGIGTGSQFGFMIIFSDHVQRKNYPRNAVTVLRGQAAMRPKPSVTRIENEVPVKSTPVVQRGRVSASPSPTPLVESNWNARERSPLTRGVGMNVEVDSVVSAFNSKADKASRERLTFKEDENTQSVGGKSVGGRSRSNSANSLSGVSVPTWNYNKDVPDPAVKKIDIENSENVPRKVFDCRFLALN